MMLDKLVLALVIIGALNWGSIGIFQSTPRSATRQHENDIYRKKSPPQITLRRGFFCTSGKEIYFSLRLHNRFFNLYILAARRRSVFSMSTSMCPSS